MLEAHKEAATTTTDFLSNSFSVSILLFPFTLYCSIFSDSASNRFGWMGAGWAGEGGGGGVENWAISKKKLSIGPEERAMGARRWEYKGFWTWESIFLSHYHYELE